MWLERTIDLFLLRQSSELDCVAGGAAGLLVQFCFPYLRVVR